jgi:hypothetical protein
MVTAQDTPGLIVLSGPSPLLGGQPQFHVYLLLLKLEESLRDANGRPELEDKLFRASLRNPWSTLGLVSFTSQVWLFPTERHQPFLKAVLKHYSELISMDGRYTNGSTTGARLWDLPSTLKYVLANAGVDVGELKRPLSAHESFELIERTVKRVGLPN